MKKLLITVLLIFLSLSLAACLQPVTGNEIKSDKARVTSPEVSAEDMAALVQGNSAFAFDLYQKLIDKGGNTFYSPYSISAALAMTYAGARGDTEKQMYDTLKFRLEQNQLHPAFNSLDIELSSRGESAKGKDSEGFRLNIVNAIWGQKDYKFQADFLDTLAMNYGAGLRILDFINSPNDSRITINNWVTDQTENKIKDIIPEGAINELTRLVLTNAIYFNAAWQFPFDDKATSNGIFHLLDKTTVTAEMMKQTRSFKYADRSNYQAIELPYDGQELSMIIMMPDEGQFTSFESGINSEQIDDIIKYLKNQQVVLTMPKFEFDSDFSLKEVLKGMGMPLAFSDQADFSGMTGNRDLHIFNVVHKAFVSVDEAGTEATAATAVIVGTTSLPINTVELTLDRPFIFLIRDIQTGAILFVGRVVNPIA